MSIKSRKAISVALEAIGEDIEDLKMTDVRHEKMLEAQALEIEELRKNVMQMRNAAIAADANNRVPYEDIQKRYGVSKSRISQIKKQFQS
ncbi:TPA: hypothetical protein ACSP8J_004229 [Aeromonas veronii]